jgi:hypothetical protein
VFSFLSFFLFVQTAATGSFPAAHQAASPSGVVYAGQETQLNILSMEEDEFSDHESVKVCTTDVVSRSMK